MCDDDYYYMVHEKGDPKSWAALEWDFATHEAALFFFRSRVMYYKKNRAMAAVSLTLLDNHGRALRRDTVRWTCARCARSDIPQHKRFYYMCNTCGHMLAQVVKSMTTSMAHNHQALDSNAQSRAALKLYLKLHKHFELFVSAPQLHGVLFTAEVKANQFTQQLKTRRLEIEPQLKDALVSSLHSFLRRWRRAIRCRCECLYPRLPYDVLGLIQEFAFSTEAPPPQHRFRF